MAKVSVIIPMYNAKRFITGCVDSLLAQTIEDVEVIVINDCSTDDSMEICRERYKDEKRVVLIDQPKNMGPGEARNAGLKKATGEYLAFVDADDGLLGDALLKMYEVAKDQDADVVHVGGALIPFADPLPDNLNTLKRSELVKLFLDSGTRYEEIHKVPESISERIDNWLEHYYHWNVWAKLFRTSFIREHGIDFSYLPLSEDQNFCFRCLIHAKNYVIMPGNYYIYRIAETSISRGQKSPAFLAKTLRALFGVSEVMQKAMDAHPFFTEHPEYVQIVIGYCLSCLEDSYVRQAYAGISREEARESQAVHDVFVNFFGANARYVSDMFFNYHDTLPKPDDLLDRMNSREFWAEALKSGLTTLLEEPS